jgi:hypothetical protein
VKQAAALFRAALPDWRSTVHDLIAEDAKVAERFTTWGTYDELPWRSASWLPHPLGHLQPICLKRCTTSTTRRLGGP